MMMLQLLLLLELMVLVVLIVLVCKSSSETADIGEVWLTSSTLDCTVSEPPVADAGC